MRPAKNRRPCGVLVARPGPGRGGGGRTSAPIFLPRGGCGASETGPTGAHSALPPLTRHEPNRIRQICIPGGLRPRGLTVGHHRKSLFVTFRHWSERSPWGPTRIENTFVYKGYASPRLSEAILCGMAIKNASGYRTKLPLRRPAGLNSPATRSSLVCRQPSIDG